MMKKTVYILSFLLALSVFSCKEPIRVASFEDLEQYTIYDYIIENKERFSSFLSILEAGELDITLGSYNPQGQGYTLFLPDNEAVDKFIGETNLVSSLDDILNDPEFAKEFCRYHVVNLGVHSGNFPFGAFPEPTLSSDLLTVSFIIESDSSYYKINNQAVVIYPDIEVSNGYIHLIDPALKPVSQTTCEWLELNSSYSIFKDAVDLTGFTARLDIDIKENDTLQPLTLLVESDEVFNVFDIYSVNDLVALISPENNDYTSSLNPLYNFVGYHILDGNYFIDDFEGIRTNYTTLSDVPLNIDGTGIEFAINRGKEVFDTLVVQGDTTFVDYIGFFYDQSNVLTRSGAIHMINKVMKQQIASKAIVNFQFLEEPLFNQFRAKEGSYLIEEDMHLNRVEWKGVDLYFVDLGNQESTAWGADYLEIDGDFEISYQVSKIVRGVYELYIGAEMLNRENAMVEVFLDGKKVGGFVDLSKGGTVSNPFQRYLVGTVDLKSYQSHKVEVKSLIPGRFLWDYVRFEPI